MKNLILTASLALLLLSSSFSQAKTVEALIQECLFSAIKTADKQKTLQEIETLCEQEIVRKELGTKQLGAISERIIKERKSAFNPYVITPHKMNYILPATLTDNINQDAYSEVSGWSDNFKDVEAKFQLSIKVPLATGDIFTRGDQFFFGFTLESWWQLYAEAISRPFRETNYQPEFFYITPLNWHPFDTNTGVIFGFEHQSNGRSQLLSRSWNRAYVNFLFEKNNFALSFKPWFRIPEDEKESSISATGDDNPNIHHYMGHFELGLAYDLNDKYELSMKLRQNFTKHHGAVELGFTFPLWGKLRGYAQYFNGYGESLIDYNHKQQRIGFGIALTDIL